MDRPDDVLPTNPNPTQMVKAAAATTLRISIRNLSFGIRHLQPSIWERPGRNYRPA